jgi:hypothetical protein
MRNPMALTGRTVIVTGTGQGIGRAISELALDLGANLVMVERNPETFAAVSSALAGRPDARADGRRDGRGLLRAHRGRRGGALRRRAWPGEQCRHHAPGDDREDDAAAVAGRDRREPDRLPPDAAGGGAAHDRACAEGGCDAGRDRQHLLHRGQARLDRAGEHAGSACGSGSRAAGSSARHVAAERLSRGRAGADRDAGSRRAARAYRGAAAAAKSARFGAVSTIWPRYITATRSAMCAPRRGRAR